MRELLFVQDSVQPPGGGNGVAAWMLQSLVSRGRVTLLTRVPFDPEEVDRYYGTTLSEHPIENRVVVSPFVEWLSAHRVPVSLARFHYLMRSAKKIAPRYDLVCSACNELDFGVAGLDYVHYPWNAYPRPDAPSYWDSNPWLRQVLKLYNWLCCRISGFRKERPNNLTLANSGWTRDLYSRVYPHKPCFVLNPPALADVFPDKPEGRRNSFLSIGRVAVSKEWEKLITIVEGLRARGHDVGLTLAGSRDDRYYEKNIRRRAEQAGDWVQLRLDQTREELQGLLQSHRFGLHGMVDEHFGMAVAELILGGCLTVVPNNGGQTEIVADRRLRYDHAEEAIDRCHRFLSDDELRTQLWQAQKAHREKFTKESFQRSFEELVDRCLAEGVESVVRSLS